MGPGGKMSCAGEGCRKGTEVLLGCFGVTRVRLRFIPSGLCFMDPAQPDPQEMRQLQLTRCIISTRGPMFNACYGSDSMPPTLRLPCPHGANSSRGGVRCGGAAFWQSEVLTPEAEGPRAALVSCKPSVNYSLPC